MSTISSSSGGLPHHQSGQVSDIIQPLPADVLEDLMERMRSKSDEDESQEEQAFLPEEKLIMFSYIIAGGQQDRKAFRDALKIVEKFADDVDKNPGSNDSVREETSRASCDAVSDQQVFGLFSHRGDPAASSSAPPSSLQANEQHELPEAGQGFGATMKRKSFSSWDDPAVVPASWVLPVYPVQQDMDENERLRLNEDQDPANFQEQNDKKRSMSALDSNIAGEFLYSGPAIKNPAKRRRTMRMFALKPQEGDLLKRGSSKSSTSKSTTVENPNKNKNDDATDWFKVRPICAFTESGQVVLRSNIWYCAECSNHITSVGSRSLGTSAEVLTKNTTTNTTGTKSSETAEALKEPRDAKAEVAEVFGADNASVTRNDGDSSTFVCKHLITAALYETIPDLFGTPASMVSTDREYANLLLKKFCSGDS